LFSSSSPPQHDRLQHSCAPQLQQTIITKAALNVIFNFRATQQAEISRIKMSVTGIEPMIIQKVGDLPPLASFEEAVVLTESSSSV
jgi:hypothetical protein